MLNDLIVARAYLHTDRIDLVRAGEIDCAWHALFRRLVLGLTGARRRIVGLLR